MERPLTSHLNALLNETASLGVGVGDTSGLLIQSSGLHAALAPDQVAAHLSQHEPLKFEQLSEDSLVEAVLIGQRYCFYLRWLTGGAYFVYVMTEAKAKGGEVRYALKKAETVFARALGLPAAEGLTDAAGERLEQPRKFLSDPLVR